MKLVVFSDSHGLCLPMVDICEKESPDTVLHLGDCVADAELLRKYMPCLNVVSVAGNNDCRPDERTDAVIDCGCGRMYICHGHKLDVRTDLLRLTLTAKQKGCAVALFGHTHIPYLDISNGFTLVNPGAICSGGSYALCTDGKWELKNLR